MLALSQDELINNYFQITADVPLITGDFQQIQQVAPHLTDAQTRAILESVTSKRGCYVEKPIACPPIMVQGAYHTFVLIKSRTDITRLGYGCVRRRRASYACNPNGVPDGLQDQNIDYLEEVQNYAAHHWPDKLLWDRAKSILRTYLVGPSCGVVRGGAAAISCNVTSLIANGGTEPISQLIDDAILRQDGIVACSWNFFAVSELMGNSIPYAGFYCSLCAGGIAGDRCCACGARYNGRQRARASTTHPLPSMLWGCIDWAFEIDPMIACAREAKAWADQQLYKLAIEDPEPARARRVIEL